MTKDERKHLRKLANMLRNATPDKYLNSTYADGLDELIEEDEKDDFIATVLVFFFFIFAIIGIICCARYLFF